MATIQSNSKLIVPRPQVYAYAEAVRVELGITGFSTYVSHDSPSPDLCLDIWPSGRAQGDALAEFTIQPRVVEEFGIDYHIWWQQIFNPPTWPYWRDMPNRGNNTQNHKDHGHTSFVLIEDFRQPAPNPTEEHDMFIFSTARNVDGGSYWFVVAGVAHRMHSPSDVQVLLDQGVPNYGELSESFLNVFERRG